MIDRGKNGWRVIRWKILLPIVMTLLSICLMLLAGRQQHHLSKLGTGWEPPARVVNSIINGPGFYFGRHLFIPAPNSVNAVLGHDGDRLPGVVLMWFLIGLTIDRRLRKRAPETLHPFAAVAFFAVSALVCAMLAFGGMGYVFCPSPNQPCLDQLTTTGTIAGGILVKHPLQTVYTMSLATSIWLFVFSYYFAKKTIRVVSQFRSNTPRVSSQP